MIYLLFMVGVGAVIWGVPALIYLFVFKMPVLQALLFGFLTGSLALAVLEVLGLFSNSVRRLTRKGGQSKRGRGMTSVMPGTDKP